MTNKLMHEHVGKRAKMQRSKESQTGDKYGTEHIRLAFGLHIPHVFLALGLSFNIIFLSLSS